MLWIHQYLLPWCSELFRPIEHTKYIHSTYIKCVYYKQIRQKEFMWEEIYFQWSGNKILSIKGQAWGGNWTASPQLTSLHNLESFEYDVDVNLHMAIHTDQIDRIYGQGDLFSRKLKQDVLSIKGSGLRRRLNSISTTSLFTGPGKFCMSRLWMDGWIDFVLAIDDYLIVWRCYFETP